MANKTYRCLACGFALTIDASEDVAVANRRLHKQELSGVENDLDCPACHGYLKRYGGRKNGKVWMPDISTAGSLRPDEDVRSEVDEMQNDLEEITATRAPGRITALRKKYKNKKLFGFSIDDLLEQHDQIKAQKAARS